MNYFAYYVATWLFLVGLYGIVTSRNLIALINCLGVMTSSSFIVLLAVGYRQGATAPVYDATTPPGTPAVDPVVQAMVLTEGVVGIVITALLFAVAVQSQKHFGTLDPDELVAMKG